MKRPGRGYASPGPCQSRPPWVGRPTPWPTRKRRRKLLSSWVVLPATQDGVRQDARAKQQRSSRQNDGRTTSAREVPTPAVHHGHAAHHGGLLRHRHGRKYRHEQESGRSQEYCPLHPVLLLKARLLQASLVARTTSRTFCPNSTHATQLGVRPEPCYRDAPMQTSQDLVVDVPHILC